MDTAAILHAARARTRDPAWLQQAQHAYTPGGQTPFLIGLAIHEVMGLPLAPIPDPVQAGLCAVCGQRPAEIPAWPYPACARATGAIMHATTWVQWAEEIRLTLERGHT